MKNKKTEARNAPIVITQDQQERFQELEGFVRDARAYIVHALGSGAGAQRIVETLAHDISGLARREICFVPRVTGYAAKEARS